MVTVCCVIHGQDTGRDKETRGRESVWPLLLLPLSERQRGQATFEMKSLIKDKQSATAAHLRTVHQVGKPYLQNEELRGGNTPSHD